METALLRFLALRSFPAASGRELQPQPSRVAGWRRRLTRGWSEKTGVFIACCAVAAACVVAFLPPLMFAADAPPVMNTILAFGDSLTAGLGVPVDEAYPARLERRLRKDGYAYRVINAGVSGETTAGGLRRVDWALQSRPDIAIVELGANDGLRGLSPTMTRANLAQIIERFQAAGVTVVLAGMRVPPNYGPEYGGAFASVFPDLARRYHTPLIPFFLEGVAGMAGLTQADGLHPTSEGYGIVVERIWPVLRPLFVKPAPR